MNKRIKKFLKDNQGQGLLEMWAVMLCVVIPVIMLTVQLAIIFTVQLAANTAAWRAARAVHVSANNTDAGFNENNNNTSQDDARNAALNVLSAVGFFQMMDLKIYKYTTTVDSSHPENNYIDINNEITDTVESDKDVWVILTCQAKIVMPFTRVFLGDGAISLSTLPYRTIKACCLTHTPHGGKNNP